MIVIKSYMKALREKLFNFRKAPNDVILRNIKKLSNKKPSQFNDIPTKW